MKKILIINFTAIYMFVSIITTSMSNVYAASWVIVPSMLATFLENAMWTTMFVYSGYSYLHDDVTVSEMMGTRVYKKHMSDNSQALKDWIAEHPSVVPGKQYFVNENISVTVDSAGKAQVGLSNSLIKDLVADLKEYVASQDNQIELPLDIDIAGDVPTSYTEYIDTIHTDVYEKINVGNICDIDDWLVNDGDSVVEFFANLGYTDDNSYIIAYLSGQSVYFVPLTFDDSFIAITAPVGDHYYYHYFHKDVFSKLAVKKINFDGGAWKDYLKTKAKVADVYYYNGSSSTISKYTSSATFLGDYIGKTKTFNYKAAYEQGCKVASIRVDGKTYKQSIYAPVAYQDNIVINPALAPSLDNAGYQYFSATAAQMEDTYNNIDALIQAYTDLTDNLADWQEEQSANQEQIIAQQTSILAGVNTVIDVLADGFADVIAAVDAVAMDIVTAVDSIAIDLDIPQSLDVALPATFWIDLEAVLADAFADMDITNDIVVTNDYAGLSDLLYELFYGLMSDLFMPNWDNFNMRVAVFESKFKWVDDLKNFIDELANIFNVQPSPKLIISLPAKKNGLDFGLKEFVLDISWYSDYKKTGDVIILAFVIAIFAWRLYLKLPSIINGNGVSK